MRRAERALGEFRLGGEGPHSTTRSVNRWPAHTRFRDGGVTTDFPNRSLRV